MADELSLFLSHIRETCKGLNPTHRKFLWLTKNQTKKTQTQMWLGLEQIREAWFQTGQ